jgi:Rrf2 family protein
MLKISKKVEYALIALKYIYLKKPGEITSTNELCQEFNLPFDTVSKSLGILNFHQILSSVKGTKGGYILNTDLSKISYMELVCMIEEKLDVLKICERGKPCEIAPLCNIIDPINTLNKKINSFLDQVMILDLIKM